MKDFVQNIWYWRMAGVRCLTYMAVVFGGTFLSMTETYTGDQWFELSTFETVRVFVTCGGASLGALLAFLDQTMAKLNKDKEEENKP